MFAHLTTTLADITMYLAKNPTVRGSVKSFGPFRALTVKKTTDKPQRRTSKAVPKGPDAINLSQDVVDFLEAINWSREDFIQAYDRVFATMNRTDNIEENVRLSNDLSVRLYAMTGLLWSTASKNKARDWVPMAIAITVETGIVQSYREALLKSTGTARKLRQEMHDIFLKVTKPWKQFAVGDANTNQSGMLVTAKSWSFADNIRVEEPPATSAIDDTHQQGSQARRTHADNTTRRSELKALISLTSSQSSQKKKPKRKKAQSPESDSSVIDLDADDHVQEVPSTSRATTTTTTTTTTAKDATATAHKKADDIQSVLASMKSIQKHRLLQCSDPDAPSGSTESIVSFAASIIERVSISPLSLFHTTPP
jgi:hypothetical protein